MKKVLFVLIGSTLIACSGNAETANTTELELKTEEKTTTLSAPQGGYVDLTYAAESSVNAVVYIKVTQMGKTHKVTYRDPFEEFFGDFFGHSQRTPQQREYKEPDRRGSGSGVIISADGYIVTNNHVVAGADEILVKLNDNREFSGRIVGLDANTDLALIKIEGKNLPTLPIGNSDNLKIGEWVLAVGNPFNLTSTVTAGIVSAKARSLGANGIESFIQTDAAINPGNSGGALVDMDGDLIGINAAIASRTGSYEGYSFAIPSNIVKKVVQDFLQYGTLQRAYLGVSIVEITEELAENKGITEMSGVYIMAVEESGGAKASGIKEGDIILSINNIKVNSNSELIGVIGQYRPGDRVKVAIQRNGNLLEKEVTLKNFEGTEEMHKEGESFYNSLLGIKVQPLSSSLKSDLGINYGLKIVEVENGIFKQKGITNDFIILSVNNQRVNSENDLNKALNSDRNGKVRIEGINSSGTYTITFEFYL